MLSTSHNALLSQVDELSTELKEKNKKVVSLESQLADMSVLRITVREFEDRVEDLKRERNLLKGNHDRLLKNMLNSNSQPHWSTDLIKERLQQKVSHLQEQLDSEVEEKRKILLQLAKEQAENADLKQEVTQMLMKHKKEVELLQQKTTTMTTTSSQSDPDFLQPSHQEYTRTHELNSLQEIQEDEKNLCWAYNQMKAAHAETALELEKTRDMLLVQHQINKHYQDELEIVKTKADNSEREHKEEWEKLNRLLHLKNNRIQQLEGNFNLNDPMGKPNGSIELKLEWESHYLSPESSLKPATQSVENDNNKAPLSVENYNEVLLSVDKHNEANLQVEDFSEAPPSVENKETDLHLEHYNETPLSLENHNEAPLSVENYEAPLFEENPEVLLSAKNYEANLSVEDYNEADLSMESYNEASLHVEDYEESLPIENYKVKEKKLSGAIDDAQKEPGECYPEVKQQESPSPDIANRPSEQADEVSETQTTDSDDVIVTPLSQKGPKRNSDKICIEIVSLAFDPEAEVMSDDSIQQVYVEYRFHDLPLSETETPVSLRKPRAGEDIHFHFNKVIDLNPVEHRDRRKFLFSMLQEKNPEQRQLKFIVVSDPEEQKNECQEVGYAYLELWQILDTGRDILEQEIDIINPQDKATSIGKLKVSLQATDALHAIFKEMSEDIHL
ncbi:X-linked retinitis pigmentosa GTPase regulator-interacting protein 1 isoform X2 [Phascolarctos cinereus]|uniref:X-linked retinitis pigmentosa GTPase regulator-interacting protein 1 isoform X2 n=1 Tax=Phascolarctos cinereus TaxID=38626 RepID=A0A6P5LT37_PHACI|nr:X-linked retinitis pigmentosa GTPase regulator-interacting protein 1 isoform X2 [Phascolarctos cinereus]